MTRTVRSLLLAAALACPALVTPTLMGCQFEEHREPSLGVAVELASATLADDCASAGRGLAADAACAEGVPCPSFCRQSGVQLSVVAEAGDASVPMEVVAIELRSLDGALLSTLEARSPTVFDGETFVAWDRQIAPGARLDVRFDTSAPDWTALGGGDPWRTHGVQYRIEMRVRIDGVERLLSLEPVSREPEVVT